MWFFGVEEVLGTIRVVLLAVTADLECDRQRLMHSELKVPIQAEFESFGRFKPDSVLKEAKLLG